MVTLKIELTETEFARLEILAEAEGFETAEAYVKALAFEPTKAELLDDIREGILAAMRGETMPTLDDLWQK